MIRVIDNKTGNAIPDVKVDDLKKYMDNPTYSISSDSLIPVDIDGKQDVIQIGDFNPQIMKLRDSSYQSNYEKYSSTSAQTQNFARQVANAFTLGGYAVAADRFKTQEELNDAKLRESFNPIGTFLGQSLPYLIPVAGEYLGAAKAGTTALRVGEIATAGMQSGAAKAVSMAAIDGAAQGFTVGVNEASLDNELTRETLGNVMFDTVLGGAAGAAVGGVVAGIQKLTSNRHSKIVDQLTQPTSTPDDKFKLDLASVTDSASAAETELFQRNKNLDFVQSLSSKIEQNAKNAADGVPLSSDDAIDNELFAGLAANDKILEDAVNGKIDLQLYVDNLKRYKELSKIAGQKAGYVESNPRQMVSTEFHENIESIQSIAKEFNKSSIVFEQNKLAENIANNFELQRNFDSIYSSVYAGNDSIQNSVIREIESYTTPNGIFKRLNKQFPNSSRETIATIVKSEESSINKSLFESAKSAIIKRGLELENTPNISTKDIFNYLEKTTSDLDSLWGDYTSSLAVGTKPAKKEIELFNSIKSSFYNEIAKPDAAQFFGENAVLRAKSKQIRAELMSAERNLKKLIGQKGSGELDLKKLNKLKSVGMGSGNTELTRKSTEVVTDYLNKIKEVIPKMQEVYPDLNAEALATLQQKAINAEQNLRDLFLINDRRVTGYWNQTEKGINLHGADGHVSSKVRMTRIAHDVLEGNLMFAKMQAIGLISDKVSGKVIDAFTKAKTPQEVMTRRLKVINAIKNKNESIMKKISEVSKSLSMKSVSLGSLSASTMPYISLVSYDKKSHNELDNKYTEKVKQINSLITATNDRVAQVDAHMKSLHALAPNLSRMIESDLLAKCGIIAKSLPRQSSPLYGDAPLTMAEKAKFIDNVEAGTNPEKMLDLINNRTISVEQLQIFQNVFPTIYNRLKQQVLSDLSTSDLSNSSKLDIYSMFGFSTTPLLSNAALMKEFATKQATMQTTTTPQTMQQSGGTIRQNSKGNKSITENYKFSNKP